MTIASILLRSIRRHTPESVNTAETEGDVDSDNMANKCLP